MKKILPITILNHLFDILKIFAFIAAITYIAIQTLEIFQRREVLHLTIFTLMFVIASFQLSISTYFQDIESNEHSYRLFGASMIMFCAGFFELVDVAIDHSLSDINKYNYNLIISIGSITEYVIALSAIIIAMISLENFRITIKNWISVFRQQAN